LLFTSFGNGSDHDRSANELHILLECGDVDLANLLKNRLLSDRQQQLLLPLQSGPSVLPDQPSGAFMRSLWVDMLHAVAVLHKAGEREARVTALPGG